MHLSYDGVVFNWGGLCKAAPSGMRWEAISVQEEKKSDMSDSWSSTQGRTPAIMKFRFVSCEVDGVPALENFSMYVPYNSLTAVLSKSDLLLETVASIIADLYKTYTGHVFYGEFDEDDFHISRISW